MKFISLFSGIGGFELSLEAAGMECVGQVEINPYCQALLKLRFPNVKKVRYIHDVKEGTFEPADLICGGFPCQPFSVAGKQAGTKDDRHLWPEMFRVIQIVKPTWVIAENVRGLLSIEGGMVFEQVCLDLEGSGYDVQAFVVPAVAVNAPHRRDRLWIVANLPGERCNKREQEDNRPGENGQADRLATADCINSNTETEGLQRADATRRGRSDGRFAEYVGRHNWNVPWQQVAFTTCDGGMDDGLHVGMDGLKLSKAGHRVERLKALGNAVVPQVVYQIGKAIMESERMKNDRP